MLRDTNHYNQYNRNKYRVCKFCSAFLFCIPAMIWGLLLYVFISDMTIQFDKIHKYSPANTFEKIDYVCREATFYKRGYTCTQNPCCTWQNSGGQNNVCVPKDMTSYATCPCGGACIQAKWYADVDIAAIVSFSLLFGGMYLWLLGIYLASIKCNCNWRKFCRKRNDYETIN